MKKMKLAAFVLAATGMLATQAHASDARNPQAVDVLPPFSQTEMTAMFDASSAPAQFAALSPHEMKETEGAYGLAGAAIGSAIYIGSTAYDSWNSSSSFSSNVQSTWSNVSTSGLALAAGTGFVGGAYSNLMLRAAGYTGYAAQWTAPAAAQVVVRGNGTLLSHAVYSAHPAQPYNASRP